MRQAPIFYIHLKCIFYDVFADPKVNPLSLSICAQSPSFRRKTASYFHRERKQKKIWRKSEGGRQSAFYFSIKTFFPSLSLSLSSLFPSSNFVDARAYHWDHNENTYSDAGYGSKTYDWRPVPYIYSMCFASLLSRIKSDRSKVLVHTKIFCFFFS